MSSTEWSALHSAAAIPSLPREPIPCLARVFIVSGCPYGAWATALKEPSHVIPSSKYPMIHRAVVKACDAMDGLRDGLIGDPRRCRFDFKTLECRGEDSASCLTSAQVESAQKVTNPVIHPKTGETIFPGLALGTELGWATRIGGPAPHFFGTDYFKYVFYKNPNWDWRTFDLETALVLADGVDYRMLNATNPDLRTFPAARWQTALVSRVERSEFLRPIHHRLLRARARHGRRWTDRGVASAVSRAGDGTLRRWRRTQRVRPYGCARTMGRKRPRPRDNHCLTPHRWKDRPNPTIVPVSTGREVPRHRKYRRSSEFHLPVAVMRWLEKIPVVSTAEPADLAMEPTATST